MRKCILTILTVLVWMRLQAQTIINEQYASSVIAFSSEYSAQYAATLILGAPNRYPGCGNADNSWTPLPQDGGPEFISVAYSTPQQVNTIRIYETLNPGAVSSVEVRNSGTGTWSTVYSGTTGSISQCSRLFEVTFSTTAFLVDGVRINVDNNVPGWQYYDAVSIANFSVMNYSMEQYVSSVISFSSEYSTTSWSAQQTVGPPNTNSCGDISTAWATSTMDGNGTSSREYIELKYNFPAHVNRIRIYETFAPGSIDTVYLRDAATGTLHQIYSRTAAATPNCPNILELNFTETSYDVDAVRIAMDIAVPGWNEIDAVSLRTNLPGNAKFTLQSGNWSDPSVWSGNTLPAPTDTIIIGDGHTIDLDMDANIKSAFINTGGSLNINTPNTLILGNLNGGKEFLLTQGALNVSGGTIIVNGHVEFDNGSDFTMSSGNVIVDGNDGTDAGSVPDGIRLFYLKPGMNLCLVTGGTLTVVDPQFHATGQSLAGNYTFGVGSTVKFGNGVSTQPGNNVYGFGGTEVLPQFHHLVIDAVTTGGNRHLSVDNAIALTGDLTVTSGMFNPVYVTTINGNLLNNGTIANSSSFRVFGNATNNGSITMNAGSFSVGNHFFNNATGSYNVLGGEYTSIGGDLVNNGSFTSNWLYMANNFGISTVPQTIGGTGTFSIYGLDPINSNTAGVSLLVPLTIQYLYFEPLPGKVFLGNNNLTVQQFSYGTPGADRYVVINGNGKLVMQNITTLARICPVGTNVSYTPITIQNGSGHDFSISVRGTFTSPAPTAPVNREWDITDLTGGAVSAMVTFQWNASDEDPSFTRSLCHAEHYTTSWNSISPGAAASGTDPYSRTITGVSSFSPFGIFSGGVVLPVHLLTFSAEKVAHDVRLSWKVADEKDMSMYEIERSSPGKQFEKLLSVTPVNQVSEHTYTINDVAPLSGVSYYRLKQVESNGRYTYSAIAKIDFSHKYSVLITPNPARQWINVQGLQKFQSVELIDAEGRTIKTWKISNSNRLNVADISIGNYYLRLVARDEIQTHPVLINR